MTFNWLESPYHRIPDFLLTGVLGFKDSSEYACLNATERAHPPVVAAALSGLLVRTQRAALDDEANEAIRATLASAYDCIEVLARSQDRHVKELVVSEIFEKTRASDETWRAIAFRLGPRSKMLLVEWIEGMRSKATPT